MCLEITKKIKKFPKVPKGVCPQGNALVHDKISWRNFEKWIFREIFEIEPAIKKNRFVESCVIVGSGWRVSAKHEQTGLLEEVLPSRETGKLGELLERKLSRGSVESSIESKVDGIGSGEGRGRERKKFETAARRKWVWCGSKDRSRWEIDPDNSARWL